MAFRSIKGMKKTANLDPLDVKALDHLIRDGQLGVARERLLEFSVKSIDRTQVIEVANLARRLNMPKMMIKFLRPIVRSQYKLQSPATEQELALYATALSRLGVFAEAESILKKLKSKEVPEVLLYQAMTEMFQWNYTSPVSKLKKYVQSKTISEYERLVGYVNIAASYIWNMEWQKGQATIQIIQEEIDRSSDPHSHRLIYGYSFELLAEMSILQRNFKNGDAYLLQAEDILRGSKSRYEFFVKKWKAISKALQNFESSKSLDELRIVRKEAIELKDWETYRDCEFYEALARRDQDLFLKVYYGTPYASFRSRVQKIFQPNFSLDKRITWTLNPENISSRPSLALKSDLFQKLEDKPLLEKLFSLLCQDFYRPLALGSLVSKLYPDEYFNPDSSPQKAWQIVDRLRTWFHEQSLPLDIELNEETCRLISRESCQIPVQEIQDLQNSDERKFMQAALHFKDHPFGAKELSELLKISKRSAQNFCQLGLQSKKIIQTSAGRSTRYKFRKK